MTHLILELTGPSVTVTADTTVVGLEIPGEPQNTVGLSSRIIYIYVNDVLVSNVSQVSAADTISVGGSTAGILNYAPLVVGTFSGNVKLFESGPVFEFANTAPKVFPPDAPQLLPPGATDLLDPILGSVDQNVLQTMGLQAPTLPPTQFNLGGLLGGAGSIGLLLIGALLLSRKKRRA